MDTNGIVYVNGPGSLILNGTGGGSGIGGSNVGIFHNSGTIQAGSGSTVTLTGTGGSGSGGGNRGVSIGALGATDFTGPGTVTINGTGGAGSNSQGIYILHALDGAYDLTLFSADTVFFDGALGGVTPLASLSVTGIVDNTGNGAGVAGFPVNATAAGNIAFNQAIITIGGPENLGVGPNGGDVVLTTTGGSISVGDITASGTSGATTSGNGGGIALQPAEGLSSDIILGTVPDGTVTFTGTSIISVGGTTGTPGTDGAVDLAILGRTEPASIATMIGTQDLSIQCGAFTMGVNESLTVFGNCTIDPGPVVVSSIVALDQLTIIGTSITLNPQPPALYKSSNGFFYLSESAHLLSRIAPSFTPDVNPPGSHTGTVGVSNRSIFESALLFGSTVLNFDAHIVNPDTQTEIIFDQAVAMSQLDRLFFAIRGAQRRFFPYYTMCLDASANSACQGDYFYPFIFESDIMTDAARETLIGAE